MPASPTRWANALPTLDATGPSSADGTRLQIWDWYAGANQVWQLP